MHGYRCPLLLACVCWWTTLVMAALDGSIQNQRGSSFGLGQSLAAIRDCADTKPQCRYWNCKHGYIKKWCPKKCGLCKPLSTASPTTTHFSSTVKTPTTHGSTTEKIPTTHSSTTVKTPSTHSSSMATALTTSISTMELKTPKEESVTTRHGFQTTLQSTETTRISFPSSTVSETTSTEQKLTEKPTTNQTSDGSSNAYATYSKSGLDVAMVTSIAVRCLFVIAIVILLFVCKRRRKRRGASLTHEPGNIITMQPFNYTRDKPHDTSGNNAAARIYEELHVSKGTEQLTDELKDSEPFYHVLEENKQHQSFQNQHLYACADFNSHENEAFDLSGQTVHNQSRSERVKYETVTSTSVLLDLKNQVIQDDDNYRKDDFEKPYYHVLEKGDSNYQANCDGTALPVYQPLIGVKKDAMRSTTERCRVYQPLTGIRPKGAKMS